MIHQQFVRHIMEVIQFDESIVGLAVGGSWITDELDEYSDLDLVLVTREKTGGDREKMMAYAASFGELLSAFTGEHVGEPRLLICLYDNPLLHVDIKFVTPEEFHTRVENPFIVLDTDAELDEIVTGTPAAYPPPDYQWIEDRFWTWVHYALQKTGRGELMEALDFFGFIRNVVTGPLLQVKNGLLPRGVRRVEENLPPADLEKLAATIPAYDRAAILKALHHTVALYRELRQAVFPEEIRLQAAAEEKVMQQLAAY
ncbi:aminoglycoside 6-adenylyltransferase [Chitinophaga solisilvae]|uniref:aminoglycoside 6-adenylyltransferase n=1 Tax=Chitinophaga solisilvae TaxID=1233460 RepID=UPI00136D4743|nr:aminoglycoside 6-adenylyltransferase [Chitinophaga solisilvae]